MQTAKEIIMDVYPGRAQYMLGDVVNVHVEYQYSRETTGQLKVTIYKGLDVVDHRLIDIEPNRESQQTVIIIQPDTKEWQGYGVDVQMICEGECVSTCSTAFDVVDDWRRNIRYGFLSDFAKEDEGDEADVATMRKYHINTVQFYDWMYKHEDLVPSENHFEDMLGRPMSFDAVRDKIDYCHKYGMKAMAYTAVYACSKGFYETHKDWGMYTNHGQPESLSNWLYLMDVSPNSPWSDHICKQFAKTLRTVDFDGIHLDTYGFPKKSYVNREGKRVLIDLAEELPPFIDRVKDVVSDERDNSAVTFNNVGNFPTMDTVKSHVDAVYIEVWDPSDRYYSLYETIRSARMGSDKPINLAAYIKPFADKGIPYRQQENALLLTSAVIFASGGYHLVMGEKNGVLNDPYFPKYATLEEGQDRRVRDYFDFVVRYGDMLLDPRARDISMTHANGINTEYVFEGCPITSYGEAGKVWTMVKEVKDYYIIHLINLCGLESSIWHEAKEDPIPVKDIGIKVMIEEGVKAAYVASPDAGHGVPMKLDIETSVSDRGTVASMIVPELKLWSVICLKK